MTDEMRNLVTAQGKNILTMSLYDTGKLPGFDVHKPNIEAVMDLAVNNMKLAQLSYLENMRQQHEGNQNAIVAGVEIAKDMNAKFKIGLSLGASKFVLDHAELFPSSAVESARSLYNSNLGRYETSDDLQKSMVAYAQLFTGRGLETESGALRASSGSGTSSSKTTETDGDDDRIQLLKEMDSFLPSALSLVETLEKKGYGNEAKALAGQLHGLVKQTNLLFGGYVTDQSLKK
jgi:hypothetical protein